MVEILFVMRKIVLVAGLFVSGIAFGQSPKAIEADLLKAFKKIEYWETHMENPVWSELLFSANRTFGLKLKGYAGKYPALINYPFRTLSKEIFSVSTSSDSLFRIYSWDTRTGGTMRFYESVFQYKYKDKTNAILDSTIHNARPFYNKIYTLKTPDKTYYLAVFVEVGSTRDIGGGIQVFAIENEKLNNNVKIIKTTSGMNSMLSYYYDRALSDDVINADVYYNTSTQTIKIPLIVGKGKLTAKYITYKFTGQYFEKVKS